MTTRLYYTEPWCQTFEATVRRVEQAGGTTRVSLDRTAFYPTSGGQPFDTGTLGGCRVVDVVDGDAGEVWHLVDGPLDVGARVAGVVDWLRRFDHMQQHTGQHLLSAAFERLHSARTESFHLGADVSTIDLDREVGPDEAASAALEASRVVWDDRPVAIRFVDEAEAARLPLRKPPVRGGRLRLIDIERFDLSACGGTHVSRTGEVGVVAVRGWERFKGGTRVTFVCGGRALSVFEAMRDTAAAAARVLSVGEPELSAAIERLMVENKEQRRVARQLAERLAAFEAADLARRATDVGSRHVVVEALEGYDAVGLKALASAIVAAPARLVVLFTATRPALVVAARSKDDDAGPDMSALLKHLFTAYGGRGGGRPELAQGGGLDAPSDVLVSAAQGWIDEALGR
jgi:alanyl-tRNA synthetase